jgi:hypothetical protein
MAGAATFGAALQIGLNKAGDLIRQAREAGNDLLLGTGVEIQNAITSAQIAYESSLSKTMQEVGVAERKFATDMDTIFQTNLDRGARAARELLGRTQIIANTVPFANKIPQVAGYSPHFVLPAGDSIRLEISGNFPFGFSRDEIPILAMDGQPPLKASSFSTSAISFSLPRSACSAALPNRIGVCAATFSVPWDASRWFNVFGRKIERGIFKVEFGVLPQTPGTMSLRVPTSTPRQESAYRVSGTFNYDSSDNDIEENRSLRLTEAEIRDGWRIVPNTWRFELVRHIEGVEGHDWYNMGYQGSSDIEVIWRARTERKHIGSSGKIMWRIGCTIARTVQVAANVDTNVPLSWAMSENFKYNIDQWKLTWTRFDGAKRDITKTDLASDFLRVTANGTDFTIATFGQ